MRILYIVPYTPTLIRSRSFNLLHTLQQQGHHITLATLWQSEEEGTQIDRLQQIGLKVVANRLRRRHIVANLLRTLPTPVPLQAQFCRQPELERAVRALVSREGAFDVIHVEHLRGSPYLLAALQARRDAVPVVWDSVDCISHLFKQAAAGAPTFARRKIIQFDLKRTRLYEPYLARRADVTLLTSNSDKAALQQLIDANGTVASAVRLCTLSNGVDCSYFAPDATHEREEDTLVVSGKMSYHANEAMVNYLVAEIMPRIWQRRPKVKIFIVGKDPSPSVQAFSDHPNIEVTGTVADVRPYLQQAAVALAPLTYGSGVQNKVLEAMACATPIVVSVTAAGDLAAEAGRDFFVASSADQFARNVLTLLEDSALRREIGCAGRRFVEIHHSWQAIGAQLTQVYNAIR